jgi:3-methyl-2-oxobutanoate hydroxymethyltransferase
MSQHRELKKVTTESLRLMKGKGRKIACLTAYDAIMAELLDEAGIDLLLVGDSAGTVIQGLATTISVTLEQMLYHCKIVSRSVRRALVVVDLPFLSFQISPEEALRNAGTLMKEAGAEAVKLEGGAVFSGVVKRLTDSGIPVMGHLGLTPQSIHSFGTYRVRGDSEDEAQKILEDAVSLEQAGAFAIVLEKIPSELGKRITEAVDIPTIGIGAGPDCDGQILVTHDMLGLFTKFHPRFVRHYANMAEDMLQAFKSYADDVQKGRFPEEHESY